MIAMSYGNVYVAQVAMGASDAQTVKAFIEAEAYDGPSIIMAYSHCIAHGYDMGIGLQQQKKAVESAYWLLYRYNPDLELKGKSPLQIDSKVPNRHISEFMYNENRFKTLQKTNPERAEDLLNKAEMPWVLSSEDIILEIVKEACAWNHHPLVELAAV